MAMEEIEKLVQELEDLKARLADREKALPAHSARPHQLQAIESLEEEIMLKEEEIRKMKKPQGIADEEQREYHRG